MDAPQDPEQALSGESGIVAGRRARLAARLRDLGDETASWLRLLPPRLDRAARAPERDVRAPLAGCRVTLDRVITCAASGRR